MIRKRFMARQSKLLVQWIAHHVPFLRDLDSYALNQNRWYGIKCVPKLPICGFCIMWADTGNLKSPTLPLHGLRHSMFYFIIPDAILWAVDCWGEESVLSLLWLSAQIDQGRHVLTSKNEWININNQAYSIYCINLNLGSQGVVFITLVNPNGS